MSKDAIQEKLNEEGEPTGEKLEKKPSDRAAIFSKIIDAVLSTRDEFLSNEEMTIEEAISAIQAELAKIAPKTEKPAEEDMVGRIAATVPPSLSSLGVATKKGV